MTTNIPAALLLPARTRPHSAPPPHPRPSASTLRYDGSPRTHTALLTAMAVSLGLHAILLLGFGLPHKKAVRASVEEAAPVIRLTPLPDIKELEEPEPPPTDGSAPPLDPGIVVPMQADLPRLPHPDDFVQQLNFASLVEKPDFSHLAVYAVPEHIRVSTRRLSDQIGKIFNLADLDRAPEPMFQPSPQFPFAMRREAHTGTVMIEFIVDTNGNVLDPIVRDSTHHGFDDAALSGVSRWKFRAGFKSGRKVNTRMRVPIVFTLADPLD